MTPYEALRCEAVLDWPVRPTSAGVLDYMDEWLTKAYMLGLSRPMPTPETTLPTGEQESLR